MKLILLVLVVAVCLPSLALSQLLHCHRCYGNSYCNNATHADFSTNIRNATCDLNATLFDYETDDPYLKQIQAAITQNVLKDLNDNQVSLYPNSLQAHCLTATVHEPHDSHTIRTCVITSVANQQTLCQLLQNVTQPMNRNNGTFTCRQCNGTNFCNGHTLSIGDGVGDSGHMVSASLGFIIAMITLYRLF